MSQTVAFVVPMQWVSWWDPDNNDKKRTKYRHDSGPKDCHVRPVKVDKESYVHVRRHGDPEEVAKRLLGLCRWLRHRDVQSIVGKLSITADIDAVKSDTIVSF